jgi:hypothetical protein
MIITQDTLRRDTIQLIRQIDEQIEKAQNNTELSFLLAAKSINLNTLTQLTYGAARKP